MEVWRALSDAKAFSGLSDKLIKQADGYEAAPCAHVSGKHTLIENIADLGGLATAYDAVKGRRRYPGSEDR